jgi:hypothetical protein
MLDIAAVIVTLVLADTDAVLTLKVAVAAPSGTLMDAGMMAAALLLESFTSIPPDGAAAESITVPVPVPG